MDEKKLSVREIRGSDIEAIIYYWLDSDPEFLTAMGVDLNKLPSKEAMRGMLMEQLDQPYHEKKSYCVIWMVNDIHVGHSNVNKIVFGQEAYMHLHLWNADNRMKGLGTAFVKMTLPYFFENLKLMKLYCEPYALNPAPNSTLKKAGFEFVKNYITIPGWINFEQPVNLWQMSVERYENKTG